MLWFDGSIRDAVDKVKTSNLILLVLVKGEDDLSKKYELYLNKETKFNPENYVALKISHNSSVLQQFKEIFGQLVLLELHSNKSSVLEKDELGQTCQQFKIHVIYLPKCTVLCVVMEIINHNVTVPIPSVFLIKNNGELINIVSSNKISDIHGAIKNAISEHSIDNQQNGTSKEEEKRGKQTVQKNEKKLEEAVKKTPRHVKSVGHNLFNITEEEVKKRLNEIRAFPKFFLIENPSSLRHSSFSHQVPRIQSARIQFRLPNNETPSWQFPELSTLGDVRAYLVEKMNLSPNFKLLRLYPRTSFSPQDECKTLAELSLTPNATLIVVPVQDKSVQAKIRNLIVRQSFVSIIIKTLLQPVLIVVKFFKKHVLRIEDENENRPKRLVSDSAFEKIFNKKTSTSNIHGFKFDEDMDTDGENPDNGNSTQQRYNK